MTDRELLELAAKAAGIVNFRSAGFKTLFVETGSRPGASGYYWNPLTDDGDALRLAVKLKLGIDIVQAHTAVISRDERVCVVDRCARRAIVRAAAEIGKSL